MATVSIRERYRNTHLLDAFELPESAVVAINFGNQIVFVELDPSYSVPRISVNGRQILPTSAQEKLKFLKKKSQGQKGSS